MCEDYLAENEMAEDFCVKINPADIDFEREKSTDDSVYSDSYLETLAVYRKIAEEMIRRNVFLMHGAAFAINREACLIIAPSGIGKTTFLKMIQRTAEELVIVNGDKPLVGVDSESGKVSVYGTPWSGKEELNTNCKMPLKMICVLKRGEKNSLEEISFSAALSSLLIQTYRPEKTADYMKTIRLLGKLKDRLKFYELELKTYEQVQDMDSELAVELCRKMTE